MKRRGLTRARLGAVIRPLKFFVDRGKKTAARRAAKFCIAFFLKYTATHEQVTRSAPTCEPNDHRDLTLTPDKNKKSMSQHSQLRKDINIKKQLKKAGEAGLVPLVCYKRRRKEVITETSE